MISRKIIYGDRNNTYGVKFRAEMNMIRAYETPDKCTKITYKVAAMASEALEAGEVSSAADDDKVGEGIGLFKRSSNLWA